jgi:hypothetical protein
MYIRRLGVLHFTIRSVCPGSIANCDDGRGFLEDYCEYMASKKVALWSFWVFVNIVHSSFFQTLAAQYEEPQ